MRSTRQIEDPHALTVEHEALLLSCCIREPAWIAFVSEQLRPTDFYRPAHGALFRLLTSLAARGEVIDAVSFPLAARALIPDLESLIPVATLIDLVDLAPSTTGARGFCAFVAEAARRRRAEGVLRQGLEALGDRSQSALDVVERATAALAAATLDASEGGGWRGLGEAATGVMGRIDRIAAGTEEAGGLLTGFPPLDELLGGLMPIDLCLVAGRPGSGKTALALQIAENVAERGICVGVVSLEMGAAQLAGRRIASRARVNGFRLRDGRMSPEERKRADRATEEILRLPILVDDQAGITGERLYAKIRRLWSLRPDLGLIVIDYVGLLAGEDPRASREQQVAGFSRGLKALAKEIGVPIMLLAQLSRKLEERRDKRPIPSDLRESGSLEQDADQILFVHRPEMYEPDDDTLRGKAEIIVAKNRAGPCGTASLMWVGHLTKFELPPSAPPAGNGRSLWDSPEGSGAPF